MSQPPHIRGLFDDLEFAAAVPEQFDLLNLQASKFGRLDLLP